MISSIDKLDCPNQNAETLSVVDLFAGGGGFSLGFESAGFHVSLAVEVDAWACDTLQLNHPRTKVLRSDISQFSSADAIKSVCPDTPTAIIGGPPCQGFSIAGPAKKDPSDPRNSLFIYFAKWVECLQPKFFVMENVKGLLTRKNANGEPVKTIIERTFREAGYAVQLWILNSAHYGVPQIRERIFFVGNRIGAEPRLPKPTHSLSSVGGELGFDSSALPPALTLWEAISDLPALEAGQGEEEQDYLGPSQNPYQARMRGGSKRLYNHVAMSHSKRVVERFQQIKWGQSSSDVPEEFGARLRNGNGVLSAAKYDQNNRRLYPHRPSHTIAASFYANFVHPFQHRNLTAREGARIQSFPDSYKFLGKKTVVSHRLLEREERLEEKFLCQYNQVGNAVPPLLAKAVAREIKKAATHVRHNVEIGSRFQPLAKRAT